MIGLCYSQKQMPNHLTLLLLGRSLAVVPALGRLAAWVRVSASSRKETSMEAGKLSQDSAAFDVATSGRRGVAFPGFSRELCEAYLRKRRERGSRGCILAVQQC